MWKYTDPRKTIKKKTEILVWWDDNTPSVLVVWGNGDIRFRGGLLWTDRKGYWPSDLAWCLPPKGKK